MIGRNNGAAATLKNERIWGNNLVAFSQLDSSSRSTVCKAPDSASRKRHCYKNRILFVEAPLNIVNFQRY
jgi:hypothetical protein